MNMAGVIKSGMPMKKIRQQFADTLLEVGQRDDSLVVLIGDISHFILQPFAKACPGRFYNIGICEPTIVSMAAGLAKVGFHPVVHTIAPFIVERSFEQIKLDFCYQNLSGNLTTVGSAFDYSNLGCTHHCYDDFALIKSLPNTQIVYPGSCLEFDILFKETYNNSSLTLFRLPEQQHEQSIKASVITFGKAITVREGDDCTIVVTGPQLKTALSAAEQLKKGGYDTEVIYAHTIKPFDHKPVIESVKKTKRVIVIEEHSMYGGIGDEVLRVTRGIDGIKYSFIAIPDIFVRNYGSYADICNSLGFTSDNIIRKVKEDLFNIDSK